MRGNEFLDKMGLVDPEYIEAAEKVPAKRKKNWAAWAAVAACLCIIVGAVAFMRSSETGTDADITEDSTVLDTELNGNTDETTMPDDIVTDENDNGEEETVKEGLYIPQAELPEEENVAMDMLGVVVYKGGIYVQSGEYYNDYEKVGHLVGDYLGRATGTINEWSKQDDYTQNFASVVPGDVYTVKGYDPSFRLCILHQYEKSTDDGYEICSAVVFYDRLNDIYLANGEELFEDRLHVKERLVSIQYQSHDAWNYGGEINDAPFDESIWNAFIDEVYKGEFVYTYVFDENDPDCGFYEDRPYSSIYDTPNQVHLILNMSDGTVVRMRLIEGGYVGLDGFGWYFVKIPGEAFDAIYDACGGTYIEEWIVAR